MSKRPGIANAPFASIILLFLVLFNSCGNEKKKFVKISDDPFIGYYKVGDNIQFISSDFELGNEKDLNSQAVEAVRNGNYKEGEIKLNKALSINPKSSIILNNLGILKQDLKDFPKAIKYYSEALILSDSTYFPAAMNLGKLYGSIGDDENAQKVYNYVINNSEIEFLNGISHFGLAKMYYDYGWIEKAKLSMSKSKKILQNYKDFDAEIEIMENNINNYN